MTVPRDIANIQLFYLIGDNASIANSWEIKFCQTTHKQWVTQGWVSPKQRQTLYRIAAELCIRAWISRTTLIQTIPDFQLPGDTDDSE